MKPKGLIINISKLGRHTGIMGIKYPSKNHPQTSPATHSVASRPETYVSNNSGNISFPLSSDRFVFLQTVLFMSI